MNFVGLPLTQLLTIGAIAGGAVVVLYILKLRRRPVAVPFSRIWERVLRDKEATHLFSQLKRLLSLLLQLALLAAMLLALGDPRTAQNLVEGRNVVVLVDASASMQATDVAPSRLAEGKARVRDMIRGLGASDRMILAQMDATLTPLSTLTGDATELEAALERVEAQDCRADFPRALRFAVDTLRGLPQPEIIVVSDGALGPASDALGPVALGDVRLSYVKLGSSSKNVAITAFSVRRYPLDKSRYEAMLELTNTATEPLDVELRLLGDGQVTEVTRLRLGPEERLPRFFPNLSGASKSLEARIQLADGTRDDLPVDDVAYALLPERRRARVQVVTRGNMYLEAALLLDEYLDVTLVAPERYPSEGSHDVTIFDGVTPAYVAGSGHALYLDPSGPNSPVVAGEPVDDVDPKYPLGFDEIDTDHPIVRHTVLSDVNVARVRVLEPTKDDKVVGKSFKGPILVAGRREGIKFVALGVDVRQTDLPLRISWPLFLLNVINDFVEEDTRYISSFATGTVWRVPAPSGLEQATLLGPGGRETRIPVDEGRAVFLGQKAGFYVLRGEGAEAFESGFAANLSDVRESAIAPRERLEVGPTVAGEPSGFVVGVRREIWIYLLLGVVAVSAIEWLTYHRRITV
jgi:hypothetical protein